MITCKYTNALAKILVIIGALNWGLVGAVDFNLVSAIFGEMNLVTRIVYILVGVSAIVLLANWICCCTKKDCGTSSCNSPKY